MEYKYDDHITTVPFSWNHNMAEEAQDALTSVQYNLPYDVWQSIGMALAKLALLEEQGAKVREDEA